MTKSIIRAALIATVSAAALAGSAHAQQAQQNQQQQRQQQMQPNQGQQQQSPREYQQVRGTIENVRRVNLRDSNERAIFVLLRTEDGRRAVVDLGTNVRVRLSQGSELAVRGRVVDLGDQRYVLQATAFRYEGRTVDANRPMMQASDQQSQQGQRQGSAQMQDRGQQDRGQQDRGQQDRGQQDRGQGQSRMSGGDMDKGQMRQDQPGQGRRVNALFDRYDSNGNGMLSIAEWDRGIDGTFGEDRVQLDPENWDRDGNGQISRGEFQRGMRTSGLIDRGPMGG